MCGRYYLADISESERDEYLKILDEIQREMESSNGIIDVKTTGEVFPSDTVPVIANNKNLRPKPFVMKWGYSYKNGGRPIINARSETASQKYMFKDGMKQRRLLVPAMHYYEWEKQGSSKIKHAIRPVGTKMMYMAGIYRIDNGVPEFSILTREIAPDIAFIHDRMPVILPESVHKDWLNIDYNANDVIKAALLDMEYKVA